jgi:hypothetical protein
MTLVFGFLEEINVRDLWKHEQYDFSNWLSKKDNIDYLEDTNISGVAVIDGIFGEDDITATTEVLYNKIHAITGGM